MHELVVNNYVETTVALAAWMCSKDTSAGSGLSDGILLMSVVSGIFILMKNTLRMSNAWIAVLLPISFAALFLLYGLQGFRLYFRF